MKQKILKLIKILNKFTLDDILLMDNFDEDEVKIILADFEKFGVIKKISDTEYVFLKQLPKLDETEPISNRKTITKPLITNLFSKEKEQMIYDNATEKSKKILTKYYTILKLARSRRGDALKTYLVNLAEEHPEYSISYTTFHRIKRRYLTEGLNGLIPKYKSNNKSSVSDEMYQAFKKIYLTPNAYPLKTCVKMLSKDFCKLPSYMSFLRRLNKDFTSDEIKKYRSIGKSLPHLNLSSKNTVLNDNEIRNVIKNKKAELWILYLGITPDELFAILYSDIDFENKTVLINKFVKNGKIQKYNKRHKIRTLNLPQKLIDMLDINGIGRIFKKVKIGNFDTLLNTNVKLQLKHNIPLNLIYKNLGYANFSDFEKRFNFLLPKEIDKDLDILIK